jgi:hypothetical protein
MLVHRLWTRHDRNNSAQSGAEAEGHQQARVDHLLAPILSGRRLPGLAHTDGKIHDTDLIVAMLLLASRS